MALGMLGHDWPSATPCSTLEKHAFAQLLFEVFFELGCHPFLRPRDHPCSQTLCPGLGTSGRVYIDHAWGTWLLPLKAGLHSCLYESLIPMWFLASLCLSTFVPLYFFLSHGLFQLLLKHSSSVLALASGSCYDLLAPFTHKLSASPKPGLPLVYLQSVC